MHTLFVREHNRLATAFVPGSTKPCSVREETRGRHQGGGITNLFTESAQAHASGNVQIGCNPNDPWLLDPLGPGNGFGADAHNAHTQPDGTYHYHGDPEALFDDNPGADGSLLIGFAADGYPIYGSYFDDGTTVGKAISGYTLIAGTRPSSASDPGGSYDGQYIDDYEFTDAGDLDECNGMVVDGQYGYYVTDAYPWILNCFMGTPDASFDK
jgi:hypothetical protein